MTRTTRPHGASRAIPRLIRGLAGVALAAALAVAIPADDAHAQMGPDYWQVTGVAADDHLNIRSGPGANYRVVGVAPNGFVFRNLGCDGTGRSRWCHVESPDGRTAGWVAGRFLAESGGPGHGSSAAGDDVPELHARHTGEVEIRFSHGCTVLYNPIGRRIAAGSACSRAQLNRAHDAMDAYMREHGSNIGHEGGGESTASQDVNVSGNGTIYGGGAVQGRIFGHKEGAYAVSITGTADRLTCTGLFKHPPGVVKSEVASLHCTNGAAGNAVLTNNRGGNGQTMTFTLTNGTGGYVLF